MKTYRITSVLGGFGPVCPPPILSLLWANSDGLPVTMSEYEIIVSVPDSAPAPADLGPLVKVELVSE